VLKSVHQVMKLCSIRDVNVVQHSGLADDSGGLGSLLVRELCFHEDRLKIRFLLKFLHPNFLDHIFGLLDIFPF